MKAANEISANELRIGNWVNDLPIEKGGGGNGYMQVDGMVLSDIGMFDLRPIPLTPKILEACGFNKDWATGGYNIFSTDEMSVILSNNKLYHTYCSPGAGYSTTETCFIKDLHSLHQLQNLYFDWTDTELPILIDVLKSVDTL